MHLPARVRSSALILAVLLFGSTALPLALCAFEGERAHCAAQIPQPPASRDGCHKSQPPAANLSCCCDRDDATTPMGVPGTADIASAALSVTLSPVGATVPTAASVPALETTVVMTRTRPLFTLFSTFLI